MSHTLASATEVISDKLGLSFSPGHHGHDRTMVDLALDAGCTVGEVTADPEGVAEKIASMIKGHG